MQSPSARMPLSLTFSQPRRAPFSSPSSSPQKSSSELCCRPVNSEGVTPSVRVVRDSCMASSGRAHANDDDDSEHDDDAHPNSPVNEAATPSNSSLYGTFSWSVALPSVPADKDSLADISKIRQFRYVPPPSLQIPQPRRRCMLQQTAGAARPGGACYAREALVGAVAFLLLRMKIAHRAREFIFFRHESPEGHPVCVSARQRRA